MKINLVVRKKSIRNVCDESFILISEVIVFNGLQNCSKISFLTLCYAVSETIRQHGHMPCDMTRATHRQQLIEIFR